MRNNDTITSWRRARLLLAPLVFAALLISPVMAQTEEDEFLIYAEPKRVGMGDTLLLYGTVPDDPRFHPAGGFHIKIFGPDRFVMQIPVEPDADSSFAARIAVESIFDGYGNYRAGIGYVPINGSAVFEVSQVRADAPVEAKSGNGDNAGSQAAGDYSNICELFALSSIHNPLHDVPAEKQIGTMPVILLFAVVGHVEQATGWCPEDYLTGSFLEIINTVSWFALFVIIAGLLWLFVSRRQKSSDPPSIRRKYKVMFFMLLAATIWMFIANIDSRYLMALLVIVVLMLFWAIRYTVRHGRSPTLKVDRKGIRWIPRGTWVYKNGRVYDENNPRVQIYTRKPRRSTVPRPQSLKARIVRRHQEEPPKRQIPDEGIILLDANVVLKAVGFNESADDRLLEFVRQNRGRIRIGSTARSEVDLLMMNRGTPEMYQKLGFFEGLKLRPEPDHSAELAELESRQKREIDALSDLALLWLYAKQYDVKEILEGKHPLEVPPEKQKEALREIYRKGHKDRKIAAQAYALAKKQTVTLLTSDQDMVIFAPPSGSPHMPHIIEPRQLDLPGPGSGR